MDTIIKNVAYKEFDVENLKGGTLYRVKLNNDDTLLCFLNSFST